MENVDEQLKISICSILNSASEKTVSDIILALKHVGLESLSDLQFVEESDLILVLKPIQRRKLVKAWREQSANENNLACKTIAFVSSTPTSQNTSITTNPILFPQPYMPFCANGNNLDGTATSSVSSDVSPLQNTRIGTNSILMPQPYMPPCKNDNNLTGTATVSVSTNMSPSQNTRIGTNPILMPQPYMLPCIIPPPKILNNLPPQNCKWKKKKSLVLLQVYAEYKNELFSCPDSDKMKVWMKIAHEVQQRCSLNCNELQCLNKIEELKYEYQNMKCKSMISVKKAVLFNEAKKAFETAENSVIAFAVPAVKWNKKKKLMLLKIFAKYKIELLHSGVEEQVVWKKIADELRIVSDINYDESRCRSKIDELRQEYEELKYKSVIDRITATYLDEAKRYLESTESPENKNQKTLKKSLNKQYRCDLLQVYAKYKADFMSPDIEEGKVWEKIVTELRDIYLYDCGEFLCRAELYQIKKTYEDTKKRKGAAKPYFFEEAQKAFENIENLDVSNYKVDNMVGKYIPPHLRNIENKQNGSTVSSKSIDKSHVIKVSNLSEDIRVSDLQNVFEPFGAIAHLYTIKDESDESKRFAFITFLKQQDANQAILAVDGSEFNGITFKVEWAESSQMDRISKVEDSES